MLVILITNYLIISYILRISSCYSRLTYGSQLLTMM